MREIIFDTETTGLNPVGGDRMVEIGCIEMFNRCETGKHFHAYFNPGRAMPAPRRAEFLLRTGAIDMIVDRRELRQTVARAIAILQRLSSDAVA